MLILVESRETGSFINKYSSLGKKTKTFDLLILLAPKFKTKKTSICQCDAENTQQPVGLVTTIHYYRNKIN